MAFSRANGPPGATRMMKKLIVTMMNSVGMSPRNRRTMYLVICRLQNDGSRHAPAPVADVRSRYFLKMNFGECRSSALDDQPPHLLRSIMFCEV